MRTSNLKLSIQLMAILILAGGILSCKKDKSVKDPCASNVSAQGKLVNENDVFTYTTTGGGQLRVDVANYIVITHASYPNFRIEYWGGVDMPDGSVLTSGNHENLNGKHIKDRIDSRRSFVFPDGAKITIVTEGKYEPAVSITIYEGNEAHRINPKCNNLVESTVNAARSKQMDDEEADGETATIEFTTDGLYYLNIYQEDVPGTKVLNRVLLGEIKRSEPNTVHDYYDDPTVAHT